MRELVVIIVLLVVLLAVSTWMNVELTQKVRWYHEMFPNTMLEGG